MHCAVLARYLYDDLRSRCASGPRGIDAEHPPWLGKPEYDVAVKILKGESDQKHNLEISKFSRNSLLVIGLSSVTHPALCFD